MLLNLSSRQIYLALGFAFLAFTILSLVIVASPLRRPKCGFGARNARRRTGRTPPDNEAIRPGATRPAGAERERPIEASVEPARPIVAVPAPARTRPWTR